MTEPTTHISHLPGYALETSHPFAGREAYRCDVCGGIFYPPTTPQLCPYCEDDE